MLRGVGMPGATLFPDHPLEPETVAKFRELFENAQVPENTQLISDLLDLHAEPQKPLSPRLLRLALSELDLTLTDWQLNMLAMDSPAERLSRIHIQCRLELHDRILRHAEAAGFIKTKPLPTSPEPSRPKSGLE